MIKYSLYTLLLLFLFINQAHAYIDPVTVSFLVKGIVSAIAACVVFIKGIREKILSIFGFSKKKDDNLKSNTKD